LVWHANVLLARHGCFFALGVWIWLSTTRKLAAWEVAGITAVTVVCFGEIYVRALDLLPEGHPDWIYAPMATWAIAAVAIFVISRHGSVKPTSAFLRTLGLMTYPLYLVHHAVGVEIERSILPFAGKWIALVMAVTITIGISWLICQLAEPKIRSLIRRDRNQERVALDNHSKTRV
jgi:exopolysaccharide production protein ExoZ